MRRPRAAALALLLAAPGAARAHGTFHELIAAADRAVQAQPANPQVYIRRGELYRAHGDTDAAIADYDRAANAGQDVELYKAQAYYDGKRVLLARAHAERAVERKPGSADARLVRARVLAAVGQQRAAAADYDAAFAATESPSPELVLEVARAHRQLGQHPRATAVLEAGMKKLGRIVTLQLEAIEVDLDRRRWDEALARVDELAAQSPRKESWLARRGEILARAGRRDDARQAYQGALAAIEALPQHLRGTPAMAELGAKAREGIERLAPARGRKKRTR